MMQHFHYGKCTYRNASHKRMNLKIDIPNDIADSCFNLYDPITRSHFTWCIYGSIFKIPKYRSCI